MVIGLYIDDIRKLPSQYNTWDIARSYDEAIIMLTTVKYDIISLDHDIASFRDDGREMTGYDIALWLAERHYNKQYVPPIILVHTANPVGKTNIKSVISRYLTNDNN